MRKMAMFSTSAIVGSLMLAGVASADQYRLAPVTEYTDLDAVLNGLSIDLYDESSAFAVGGGNQISTKDIEPGKVWVAGTQTQTISLSVTGTVDGDADVTGSTSVDGEHDHTVVRTLPFVGSFPAPTLSTAPNGDHDHDVTGTAETDGLPVVGTATGSVTLPYYQMISAPGDLYIIDPVTKNNRGANAITATANLTYADLYSESSAGSLAFGNNVGIEDKGNGTTLVSNLPTLGARNSGEDLYNVSPLTYNNDIVGTTNANYADVFGGSSVVASAIGNIIDVTDRGCGSCSATTVAAPSAPSGY